MSAISWVKGDLATKERLVGTGHATYADVINRPLRDFLAQQGYDPDGATFSPVAIRAHLLAGANAGLKIQAAITQAAAAGGGVVDCRGFIGNHVIDVDIFAGVVTEVPITVHWGRTTFTVGQAVVGNIGSILPSFVTMRTHGTTFVAADGDKMASVFSTRRSAGLIAVTNGSTSATILSGPLPNRGPAVQILKDKLIGIRYHKPRGGRDNTTLTTNFLNTDAVINVASTTGFPTAGDLLIGNSIVRYSGVTGTTFTGLTFGIDGTVAPATIALSGADVDRPVYDTYRIVDVVGAVITLDKPFAGPTATTSSYLIGVIDVSWRGNATIDGAKPAVNSANNCGGFFTDVSRRVTVEAGIRVIKCDHTGVQLVACNDCDIDGTYEDIGWPLEHLGFGVVGFTNCNRNKIRGRYFRCGRGATVDDRSTTPTVFDNPSNDNDIQPSVVIDCDGGTGIEGSNGNYVHVGVLRGWTQWGVILSNPQWITPPTVKDNVIIVGYADPPAGCVSNSATAHQNNTIIVRHPDSTVQGNPVTDGLHLIGTTITVKVAGVTRFNLPSSGTITFGDAVAVTGALAITGAITATGSIGVVGGVGATLGAGGQAKLNLDGVDATFAAGEMGIGENSGNMNYSARGLHQFKNATDGVTYASISNAGVINAVGSYSRAGTQVVGARKTGWAVWSGTSNRATKDTATATLADVAQTLKALIDDLHGTAGHGLIGT